MHLPAFGRIACGGVLLVAAVTGSAQTVDAGSPAVEGAASSGGAARVQSVLAAPPLGDAVLDVLRGGFDDGQGLRASFGIERSTSINGVTVAMQSVQIVDLGRISAEQAGRLATLLGGVTLIRNGPGNSLAAAPAQALAGATVIQNSLDNQQIRNSTVIDSSSNSMRLLQSINAAASLRDAVLAPLAARP